MREAVGTKCQEETELNIAQSDSLEGWRGQRIQRSTNSQHNTVCTAKFGDGAVRDFVQFKHQEDSKSTGNFAWEPSHLFASWVLCSVYVCMLSEAEACGSSRVLGSKRRRWIGEKLTFTSHWIHLSGTSSLFTSPSLHKCQGGLSPSPPNIVQTLSVAFSIPPPKKKKNAFHKHNAQRHLSEWPAGAWELTLNSAGRRRIIKDSWVSSPEKGKKPNLFLHPKQLMGVIETFKSER